MAKITKETVEYVAKLASLKFEAKELDSYTARFKRVVEYVAKLSALDTEGISPTSHAVEEKDPRLREDVSSKFADADKLIEAAPAKSGRLIEVPKVIEQE
ncbi:MAG: Asp-tRNA(Asn)/Glu-tRNA(Gln) amidotransferase subunit GatC [Deltaproteobacteria bacterium]|nr:Asp-tRNA(Asn)/Glu-tRNA(Gln) amidotransferase subunit GatC [Deltaproteobacteria bacterium]MBI2341849.1 Asp-tRNA(Asn)/Glu-tRNA(Gln) amidotransferase subunit GatC [Deltaproteobacteria bacterium]